MTYLAELCWGWVNTSWRGWGWRWSIFRRSYWTFFSSGSRRNLRTLTTSSLSVSLHDYNRRRGLRYHYLVHLRCGGLEKKKNTFAFSNHWPEEGGQIGFGMVVVLLTRLWIKPLPLALRCSCGLIFHNTQYTMWQLLQRENIIPHLNRWYSASLIWTKCCNPILSSDLAS